MKVALVSAISGVTSKVTSHKAGPMIVYQDQLKALGHDVDVDFGSSIDDLGSYDAVYVYHADNGTSRETPESLNLFGGMENEDYAKYALKLSKYKGKVFSLNCDTPRYDKMFGDRLAKTAQEKKTPVWSEVNFEDYANFWERAEKLDYIGPTDKMVIGDSHAISLYRPGWNVNSVTFKTLNGALGQKLSSFVPEGTKEIEFYFGNIDVRHHICRLEGDPLKIAEKLADKYIDQARALNASIRELLPIDDESRQLPKSGYHKGKPFWGTWEERNRVRNHFCDYIEDKYGIIRWVDYLRSTDGKLDFAFMEKPRSVHLAPQWYPWKASDQPVVENKKPTSKVKKSNTSPADDITSFFS